MRKIKFRAWHKKHNCMWKPNLCNDLSINQLNYWPLIPMQYTGLKDKNGKEIYTGDILSYKWIAEVYQNNEGTYMVKFHLNTEINKPINLNKYLKQREKAGTSERDNVIIGNIHENPELYG